MTRKISAHDHIYDILEDQKRNAKFEVPENVY